MSKSIGPVDRKKVGLGIALLVALTGCVGYVRGGSGGVVEARGPDTYAFGGPYERGRDVQSYRRRGSESRAQAHSDRSRPDGKH